MRVAILLGEALERAATLAYLPHNRAGRYFPLSCEVDDMRSKHDPFDGVDTPVATAGGSSWGDTDEAHIYSSELSRCHYARACDAPSNGIGRRLA